MMEIKTLKIDVDFSYFFVKNSKRHTRYKFFFLKENNDNVNER